MEKYSYLCAPEYQQTSMKARNLLNWMAGLFAIVLLTACPGSDEPEPEPEPTPIPTPTPTPDPTPELNISQTAFSFQAEGGSSTFSVTGNVAWTIQSTADWCTVSPTSGSQAGTVTIETAANMEASTRNCTITVKSTTGNLTREIQVTQEAHVFNFGVTTEALTFGAAASSQTIAISGDDAWTAASSDVSWCSVSPDTGSGENDLPQVTVTDNETGATRTATITLTGTNTGKSFTVNITQNAHSGIDRNDYDEDTPLPNNSNN